MNKGLEALLEAKRVAHMLITSGTWDYEIKPNFDIAEKELNEYQQIQEHFNKYKKDIQNSEGLTDLDLILMLIHNGWWFEVKGQKIKKALEIIRKKQVNVSALLELDNLQQYNAYCNLAGGCKKLTLKEYELLIGVLL